jgi:hypothetical protein
MPQGFPRLFGIALQERQSAYGQTVNAGFSIRDKLFKVGFQFGQLPVEIGSHQVTSLFDPFDWLFKNVQFCTHDVVPFAAKREPEGLSGTLVICREYGSVL